MSDNETNNTDQSALGAANVDSEAERIAQQIAPPKSQKPSPLMWMGLGGLLIVALLVIFVLPSVVTEYELPLERRAELASPALPATPVAETAVSPFEEAQRSLQRKEAQDILEELLERQAELDALEVSQWGQESYNAALEEASIGDEYYRTQDFASAIAAYGRGREGLEELLASTADVLQRILIDAQNALSTADSTTAQDMFSLALVLDSDNEIAQIGLERSRALDEVTRLMAEADDLFEDGELEAARELYDRIIQLDSYNESAPDKIAAVDVQLRENEFSRIMSEGFALLEANDPEQAIATFQRAANLGINQEQAQAAIVQTETQVANAQINALREQIAAAESTEQWADAVTAYDGVLAIDPNLTFALDGRVNASQRANLDAFLLNAIKNPERFAEDDVFEETRGYYFVARDIPNPGPRLESQLDELEQLLLDSQVPIEIQLISDNLTDVTLLRIGSLGLFEQQSLSLKPGRYVAVGKRAGYRDVREEFTVGFGQTPESVAVRCVERVVATSGR